MVILTAMKYFWFLLLYSCFSLAQPNKANQPSQPNVSPAIFNQILFTEGDQSWTARDFKLYKKIILLVTKNEKMNAFSKNDAEDFLLSRLLKREALLFEITPQKLVLPVLSKSEHNKSELNEFSKKEIDQELIIVSESLALLDLKSSQMSQKIRFQAWMEVLKRKYAVKIKSNET